MMHLLMQGVVGIRLASFQFLRTSVMRNNPNSVCKIQLNSLKDRGAVCFEDFCYCSKTDLNTSIYELTKKN